MKKFLALLIVVIMFLDFSNAFCDDFLFVSLEFPPLEYIGKNKKPTGIAVDVVTTIMERLGHTIRVKIYPWSRALMLTKKGDADAIFTAYKNPERETFLDYSNEVIVAQVVNFYKMKGRNINFDGDISKLKQYRIGVVSTISYGQKFDQAKSILKLDRVNKLEHNFVKLLKGRIDLTISNIFVAEHILKKQNMTNRIVRIPIEVQNVPSYIAFSKKKGLTGLRDQFDTELSKMKQSGEYNRIMKTYGIEM